MNNANSAALDTLLEFSEEYQKAAEQYDNDCDLFWEQLTYENKLRAFYSVTKRIHKGELIDKRSYRGVLYSVFGFGPDAYVIGLDSGYLEIHNAIYTTDMIEKLTGKPKKQHKEPLEDGDI